MPIIRAAGSIPDSKEKGIQRDTVYKTPGIDYKGRVKEYRTYQKEKKAYDEDQSSYAQAEAERPTYSRGDTVEGDTVYGDPVDYSEALSAWTEKYGDTLGRGEERYEKEKDFLEDSDKLVTKEIAYKEVAPYGVGIDVNRLLSDTDNYQVVETYTNGAPKKIQAKPKVYTSQGGYAGTQLGTYVPYEAMLDKQGKLMEERVRSIATTQSSWNKGSGSVFAYAPYEKTVLTYTQGLPSALKTKLPYKTSQSGSKGWSMSWFGTRPDTQITFGAGGALGTKSVYDEGQSSLQISGRYGSELRNQPFLSKFYDYGQQQVTAYPTPISNNNLMGSERIQKLMNNNKNNYNYKPTIDYSQYKSTEPIDYSQYKSTEIQPQTTFKNPMITSTNKNMFTMSQVTSKPFDVNTLTRTNFNNLDEYPWLLRKGKVKKQPIKQFSMVNMDMLK